MDGTSQSGLPRYISPTKASLARSHTPITKRVRNNQSPMKRRTGGSAAGPPAGLDPRCGGANRRGQRVACSYGAGGGPASVLASGTIMGIAQCGPTLLAGATIELFSGVSPVSTTTADAATGQYGFSDIGPSTYTLRIKKGQVICGSAVNVQAGAATNVPPPPMPIDLHNHAWVTAHALNPLAANGLPVAVDEYLLTKDQSAWFKFQSARA